MSQVTRYLVFPSRCGSHGKFCVLDDSDTTFPRCSLPGPKLNWFSEKPVGQKTEVTKLLSPYSTRNMHFVCVPQCQREHDKQHNHSAVMIIGISLKQFKNCLVLCILSTLHPGEWCCPNMENPYKGVTSCKYEWGIT